MGEAYRITAGRRNTPMMEEQVQVKLFLSVGGKQEEVRRFSCDGNIDMVRLQGDIREKFPHLGDKEFVIKWEDEEGDKVNITTQKELVLAMQEMSRIGSVYKFHIYILENPWWKQVSVLSFLQLAIFQDRLAIKTWVRGQSLFVI